MKKQIACLLVFAMCISFLCQSVCAMGSDITETVVQDFSSSELDGMYWAMGGAGAIVDGKYTHDPETAASLTNFNFHYAFHSDDYADYNFDLKSNPPANAANHTAVFVGLRLEGNTRMPTSNKGVWLTFANNKIGLRTDAWAKIQTMEIPYSFETERRVYLRDNQKTNTIRIYVDNDKGVKTLVANVVITGKTQKLYGVSTSGTPYATNVSDEETPRGGFVKIWTHHITNFTVDNIETVRRPYTPKYVKADPLLRRDTYSDTWVATDDLERAMPIYEEVGSPEDKKIGIFYFLWHRNEEENAENGRTLYDHYQAYLDGGLENVLDVMKQGELGLGHYWAQPEFGYYLTRDEWVIRKHANMLTQAGVDFLFFDNTNGSNFYISGTKKICEVFRKMRDEGQDTPQIVFCMGDNSQRTYKQFGEFWSAFYQTGMYEDLWFKWDGKPLILCREDDIPEEYRDYFTRRDCWAFNSWTNKNGGVGRWPWIAEYPQVPGKNPDGTVEQIAVACGFHSNTSKGRSYHNGKQETAGKQDFEFALTDTVTPLGLAFDEQWGKAHEIDPPLVMITGWNEWWAGRWPAEKETAKLANTTIYADENGEIHNYVDNFNPEFSRDIEPMSGGFGDNYYYQMIKHIRKFRGVRPIPKAEGQRTINIDGSFEQWNSVWPEYYDTLYDTAERNTPSVYGIYQYINSSGRNDIDIAKVSRDAENIYFYVSTREKLKGDNNWMYLYVDADGNHSTGWEGYDYLINRSRADGKVSVEKNTGDYNWSVVGYGDYRAEDNKLHISVSRNLFTENMETFDFKWVDNSDNSGNIAKFMSMGDAAPDSRFNFRYVTTEKAIAFETETENLLKNRAVAMVINKNTAYIGTTKVKVDKENTAVKPMVIGDKTYVPMRFFSESLGEYVSYSEAKAEAYVGEKITINLKTGDVYFKGEKVEGEKAILDNSRTYLPLRTLAELLGAEVAWDERGVIVVGAAETVSQAIFDELYRKI